MNLAEEQVVVETLLPSGQIQELLESTGRNTVLRGHGAGGGVVCFTGSNDVMKDVRS